MTSWIERCLFCRMWGKPILLGFMIMVAPLQGMGQESQAEEIGENAPVIEEIMVTARRVEESLQDTPVSVAAFTTRQLEQMGTSELTDISRATPSLEVRKRVGGLQNVSMAIRGIGEAEASLAIDPTVGVYLDGIYLARSTGLDYDIVDLERIEVLRGPQGTLFGRNTIGGAINIITEKPRGKFAFKQLLASGSRDRKRVHSVIDIPAWRGLAAKFSFLHNERGGMVNSVYHGGPLGQYESDGFRFALNWNPVDSVSADYAYARSRMKNQPNINQISYVRPAYGDPSGEFYGGGFYANAAALASDERQSEVRSKDRGLSGSSDVDSHSLILEWSMADGQVLKLIQGYREWKGFLVTEFGTYPAPADGSLCRSPNPPDYDFATGNCLNPVPAGELVSFFESPKIDSSQHQSSHELQYIGSAFDESLSFIAGFYAFKEKGREINPQRLVFSAPVAAGAFADAFGLPPEFLRSQNQGNSLLIDLPFFQYRTNNQSFALYSDLTYSPMTDLDITLGLRYTIDEKETLLRNSFGTEVLTIRSEEDWSQLNPSLTFNYRWNDQLSSYVKAVSGFRSGGYNIRATDPDAFREPFDEESVISYELGWKSDLLDRSLRFNGAIFYMDYQDQQISSLRATSQGASVDTVNAGGAIHSGIEMEMIWLPVASLQITASYAYLDVEFTEFLTQRLNEDTGLPESPGTLEDIADAAEGQGPDHSASLGIEYRTVPTSWGQWSFYLGANYTDDVLGDPQLNDFDVREAHTLLNARVTLSEIQVGSEGELRLSLWGNNLTGEEYREDGIDFGQVGFTANTYAELRSVGLDITYTFNREQ